MKKLELTLVVNAFLLKISVFICVYLWFLFFFAFQLPDLS